MKAYVKVFAQTGALLGDIEKVCVYFTVSGRGENDLHKKVSKVMQSIERRLYDIKPHNNDHILNEYVYDEDMAQSSGYPLDKMKAVTVGKGDPKGLVYSVPVNTRLICTYNEL